MCGITGFTWEDKKLLKEMTDAISYRGPDDSGYFVDEVSLGHRRLSIIDLSKKGHEPMANEDKTVWLVFNGEIYNYKEVWEKLKSRHKLRSNTDAEIIIHAYEEYGENCVNLFNGMWAFAIWDTKRDTLLLARDRMGVKPLYYYLKNNELVFASEIKAILKHIEKPEINLESLNSFLTYRFIASENTMIKGIKKLLPAHTLVFSKKKEGNTINIKKYWELLWEKSRKSEIELLKELMSLMYSSVDMRLMSDVPLGIYLSGGLDSTIVTAINSKLRKEPIQTFTVGFGNERDEFAHAKLVSDHFKTEHHEVMLNYYDMTKELPNIVHLMDEPHTDTSMMPLYFLSKFTKKYATVVNTGEGADELFSGYLHYKIGSNRLWMLPKLLKKQIYEWYYSPFKRKSRRELLQIPMNRDKTLKHYLGNHKKTPGFLDRILHFDIDHELPNWQLTRVDRMTMAHGIEARVPFLDYRIVEYSARLPEKYKLNGFGGKYILWKTFGNMLPKEMLGQKKRPFFTPIHRWMKNGLEEVSENLLLNDASTAELFNQKWVKDLIWKHKNTHKQRPMQLYSYQLFILTLFEIWHREYIRGDKKEKIF